MEKTAPREPWKTLRVSHFPTRRQYTITQGVDLISGEGQSLALVKGNLAIENHGTE